MIHYITDIGVGNAWVANELREVHDAQIPFALHSMRRPQATHHKSQWVKDFESNTHVIYPMPLAASLWAFVLAPVLFGKRFFGAAWNSLTGDRENWRARLAGIAHFYTACYWARGLRNMEVDHVHAQWAHSAATIGMYGSWLLNKPFSFTGHACDLFRDRVALRDKIERAEFIVCISTFHRELYLENGARPEQLIIVYCGIDPTHFQSSTEVLSTRPGFEIRVVCRLVEKKGIPYLIDACRMLIDRGINDMHCTVGGSGPLENSLREEVKNAGLEHHFTLTGTGVSQEELPSFMSAGDVFCLPCVWSSDQDVDGLPQTLMEAMACGVPVVSTRLVGIPDLVVHEETGLLVEPNNSCQLADALQRLHDDIELRDKLAEAGRQCVVEHFDIHNCLAPLLSRFREKCHSTAAESRELTTV
ncbi:glycosyltransferase family 4 protein [Aeoliella sp.]|uniref:glycosyltransferase family 4 protein n=1 Tax=Aeoliella sp. TaxID=2795800 RepID=UPI003CCC02F4